MREVTIFKETMFISESLADKILEEISGIITAATLIGYKIETEKSARNIIISFNLEKCYKFYLFVTPGRILSSTYLFNEDGVSCHSRDMGLIGPIEKLKELI